MSKILVTGATGHLGKATVDFLLQKGIAAGQISALARDESKAADLKTKGINVITGNYEDYASLVAAFKGVDKLLFVSANDVANRTVQQENVVKAAKEAGVKHVIYTSFERKNETETSPIAIVAEAQLKTEKWLKESGLTYTILKNNLYMDFIPVFIGDKVLETGVVYLPAGKGKAGFTLRNDMAEAAANILVTPGHEGKIYDITNVETYTYDDIASAIAGITGKAIKYVSPTVEEYISTLTGAGVPAEYSGMFAGFALAQAEGEFDFVGNDLEQLLGRKPTTLKDFLKTIYKSN